MESRLAAQLSELRALLKLKSFELDRLQLLQGEQQADQRTMKLELEKGQTKFEVHD